MNDKISPRLQRRPDWPERLAETLKIARSRSFVWGTHDCALFAADCVKSMTDVDLAKSFRGSYNDAAGAARALVHAGFSSIEDLASSFLGSEIQPTRAQRGDIVLIDTSLSPIVTEKPTVALGVVLGHYAAVLSRDDEVLLVGLRLARHAWKVG